VNKPAACSTKNQVVSAIDRGERELMFTNVRERAFTKIADIAERRAGLMLAIAILFTIVAAGLASQLKMTMHFKNLMPEDHPMVQEFDRIIDDYRTASMIIIAARGEESELKEFADELTPKVEAMTDYIQRVEYRLERDFFLEHGFMLQKARDLENTRDIYKDLSLLPLLTNLNNGFEKEYVQDEESISTKEKENNAVIFLDGIKYWLDTMGKYAVDADALEPAVAETAVERFLLGDEYIISQDKDMLLIFAQPTFTMTDLEMVVEAENSIDELISQTSEKYPSIFAGTTGTIALARDEMAAATKDMYITSLIAFVLIVALFIVSFRMWTAPILAGISLLMGIIWAAGFAFLIVRSLNIFTSMFSVVLLGLGIDFSIHIISVYNESRSADHSVGESLRHALLKSGSGIVTGATTTACAFFTLTVSRSAGMREFGIVAGSGVLFCMISAILVLPAMLALRDRIRVKLRKEKHETRTTSFSFLGRVAVAISHKPVFVLSGALIVTALLLYFALKIKFDYNYLNMEPVGLTSIKLQDEMIEEFDVTPDFALITTSSVEDARRIAEAAKDLKIIGMVDSISNYIPSMEEQQERIPYIQEIRDNLLNNRELSFLTDENFEQFLGELKRLEDNVIELSQLAYLGGQDKVDRKCQEVIGDLEDPENESMIALLINKINTDRSKSIRNLNLLEQEYEPHLRQISLGMASTEPITLESLPDDILNQYANTEGDKFLVTIYPKEQIWNIEFLERFTNQMQKLDPRVTGVPLVFYVLISIIGRDGKIAAALTLIVIFLLLYWDFKRLRSALLAMVPLIMGVVWMVGTMSLLGLKLTLVNVMGIPLILGIGIDDGVHILHRYRVEGAGNIRTTFSSTGKAIMLTSLTTMIAFGSLVLATYRGMASLGIALLIGVGMCFLTTVLALPAFLGWIERRDAKQEGSE
jgi:hopanoid biosynthesis associated RND transporter like protein HpnN